MRLIDADALIEQKFKNPISYNAFVNLAKRQPTVDPYKHGQWEDIKVCEAGIDSIWKCSVCGEGTFMGFVYRYCPWCGAKMNEVEE